MSAKSYPMQMYRNHFDCYWIWTVDYLFNNEFSNLSLITGKNICTFWLHEIPFNNRVARLNL